MNRTEKIDVQENYKVKLPNFEGPLDLLLFLIKKEEIDIYDIPIAAITRQYLEYVELMQELNLEVAGEFILMAATLIRIKVRMLLPQSVDEDEIEEDPRAELVRQLLEYKRYKEVTESLAEMEDHQRRLYTRSFFDYAKTKEEKKEVILTDVTLFDLMTAFKTVLENIPVEAVHDVGTVGVTIEEQIEYVIQKVAEKERFSFQDLFRQLKERIRIIVTFMALLELIRTHRIVVQQAGVFGEIWISKR